MTDITELALRLKIEVHRAVSNFNPQMNIKTRDLNELVEALERAQSANEYLREQSAEWERKAISNFEDCAEMSARIEELESQRKLDFAASNRWADKFREAEQRIAELESRSVKLPAERFCPAEYAGSQLWSETEVWNKAITACADELRASGIKVEAE